MDNAPSFYRMVLNHLNEGVYFVDGDRRITFWNKGAEMISGYSEAEVLGKPCYWNLLMHTNEAGTNICETDCPVIKTLNDGAERDENLYIKHKSGYRLPVSVHIMPIRTISGKLVGAVEIFSDITPKSDHSKKMKALATLAYFDLVTGLANRRYAESRLNLMLTEYEKNLSPFGLLLVNLVGFKALNDRFGQELGDQVLRSVARGIAVSVGPMDIAARWDGARFLIVSPNTKKALLLLLADKLKDVAVRAAVIKELAEIDEEVVKVAIAGTIIQGGDTIYSLKHRLMVHMQESEKNVGNIILDEG
jgi:diguanylate cyclase (GGDEF)-like protein/PAS domain S-box-containing protein